MSTFELHVAAGRTDTSDTPDTSAFLQVLNDLLRPGQADSPHELQLAGQLFSPQEALFVSRAPGRLDVMGGIADYSGALVLQMTTCEACHVALQRRQRVGLEDSAGADASAEIRIVSLHADASHRSAMFCAPLATLFPGGQPLSYADARSFFKSDPQTSWAAYVAGCLLVLSRERGVQPSPGESCSILVSSDVPEGKGVSSSAAVEVATMCALAAAHGLVLAGREVAVLCQKVENLVVGAPCGIMDQMASALGAPRRLMALLCQPAQPQGLAPLPAAAAVWGVDSGVRHAVGGSDYGSVRIAAFMGLRILRAQQAASEDGGASASTPAPVLSAPACKPGQADAGVARYLANIGPGEFSQRLESALPDSLSGHDFLARYGTHLDAVTTVDPDTSYAVRVCTSHPVHEHCRVRTFRQLLAALPADSLPAAPPAEEGLESSSGGGDATECLHLMGELMYQSHASYSSCGLGSPGTDRLVALVREEARAAQERGEVAALYGAKITGGGSGGTVAILGAAGPAGEAAVERVVAQYARETAERLSPPFVFRGSSMGAMLFGHMELKLR